MEKYNELEEMVQVLKKDMTKFYDKGNKTAGVRARKTVQNMKVLLQEIRAGISQRKNEKGGE